MVARLPKCRKRAKRIINDCPNALTHLHTHIHKFMYSWKRVVGNFQSWFFSRSLISFRFALWIVNFACVRVDTSVIRVTFVAWFFCLYSMYPADMYVLFTNVHHSSKTKTFFFFYFFFFSGKIGFAFRFFFLLCLCEMGPTVSCTKYLTFIYVQNTKNKYILLYILISFLELNPMST